MMEPAFEVINARNGWAIKSGEELVVLFDATEMVSMMATMCGIDVTIDKATKRESDNGSA